MSTSGSTTWWKEVPCHFTWNLENTTVDYKSLKTNIESKLEAWTEEYESPECQPLLFLGFLSVSNLKGLRRQNPVQAMKYFREVEKEADKMEVADEKNAFLTVALANRIWSNEILTELRERTNDDDDVLPSKKESQAKTCSENDDDLKRLKQLWDRKNKYVEAYIEGIATFALARLGPRRYKEGEDRCRRALDVIPTNPSWHYSLGCLVGRQIRCNLVSTRGEYNHLDDEIKCYENALELNPNFDLARCELAQALVKVPQRKKEAFEHIAKVQEYSCSMVVKKGRFYRFQKEYTKALEILTKGESEFARPRGELFFQISLIYSTLAYQAGFAKKFSEKNEHLEKQIVYIDKCLKVEPCHNLATIRRAQALGYLRRNDEAEAAFREAVEDMKDKMPSNFVEVQFWFAEYLTGRNRKRVTPEASELYKNVISTASKILENADDEVLDDVKTGMKKFVVKSKSKLDEFYKGNQSQLADIERMFADFHF